MERYIALSRGINISGKNKIAMSELKAGFEGLGYTSVATYLNSGNVIFSCDIHDNIVLTRIVETMIKSKFDLQIPVFIILQKELIDILNHAPDWWGDNNKEIYDNLIFMFPSLSYNEFYDEIGHPNEEYERVHNDKNAIFWSFDRQNYGKTNWWSKTANNKVKDKITIRTANTIRKIVGM